ncbi:MAG TPA: RNase adapter RapZ [Actinomycetota bacterium]|nr:RNase adapter RapZ [Actinomycetota bacterium]
MNEPEPFELIVITGLSGSGQTEATKSFQDMGYFVMDNLPPSVIEQVSTLCRASKLRTAAVVVRPSGREFFQEFFAELGRAFSALRERGVRVRIVFLDASDETLVRRYEEKRRPHPMAPTERVQDGIARERQLLGVLRDDAELVIDTTGLSPHDLRRRIQSSFPLTPAAGAGLQVTVMSFGFKYGPPTDADMVFDARFLPNPHWVPALRPLPGTDSRVRDYVMSHEDAKAYLARLEDLLEFVLPGFVREGKHYLTLAIGCTGGHHRSVVFAEQLARFVTDQGHPVSLLHRDVERE